MQESDSDNRRTIFVIIGSASSQSANHRLVTYLEALMKNDFRFHLFTELKSLPHFDPELSANQPPEIIGALRTSVETADAVLICTPEYVFSIPSGLKNAIEWCVATTVFSDKTLGIITASAHGQKAHEELQRIMKTLMARFAEENTLLIQGIKGKIDNNGLIKDEKLVADLQQFANAMKLLCAEGVLPSTEQE